MEPIILSTSNLNFCNDAHMLCLSSVSRTSLKGWNCTAIHCHMKDAKNIWNLCLKFAVNLLYFYYILEILGYYCDRKITVDGRADFELLTAFPFSFSHLYTQFWLRNVVQLWCNFILQASLRFLVVIDRSSLKFPDHTHDSQDCRTWHHNILVTRVIIVAKHVQLWIWRFPTQYLTHNIFYDTIYSTGGLQHSCDCYFNVLASFAPSFFRHFGSITESLKVPSRFFAQRLKWSCLATNAVIPSFNGPTRLLQSCDRVSSFPA